MASKINYGVSKKGTNTAIASKINNAFSLQRVLQDLMIRTMSRVSGVSPAGLYSPFGAPRAFCLGPPVTIPQARKRGVPPPTVKHWTQSAGRGVSPTFLRDAPCRPRRSPSPRPGAGRNSPLIGAGRGVSPTFLRDAPCRPRRSPSPRPGAGRNSPLIGAGLAGCPCHHGRVPRCKRILNPTVYPACTSLRRFCGFSRFCVFVESISYAVSISPRGSTPTPGT
jgi:hypothetical protein